MHPAKPLPSYVGSVAEELIGIAGDYVRGGGVRVSVKTNFGPELPVYDSGGAAGGGIAGVLGFKAGVIVRSKDGAVLATYGDPPPTEPLKVVALLALLALLGFVLIRGVLPK